MVKKKDNADGSLIWWLRKAGINWERSAFVTDGALLGIKAIGRNAEHIIALDADAVDDRANDGARLDGFVQATRGKSGGFLWDALGGHERILARRGLASLESRRHP